MQGCLSVSLCAALSAGRDPELRLGQPIGMGKGQWLPEASVVPRSGDHPFAWVD